MQQTDQDIRNRLLVARLPAMPQILLKLIELCQTDEAGMAELAKLIANDAGMTAKVLNVANSAAYHRGGRKVGLVQALTTLGSDMIKTLVISESVFQTFNGFPHAGSTDLRAFWKHALTTAVLAREIAKKMAYSGTEEAYLAGLMHDVGRLALLAAAPNEYSLNFRALDDEKLCEVEQLTLQISHAEAGAWLVERWNLDSFMADSILYHHEVGARLSSAHPLIRIIHLAESLGKHSPELPLPTEAGALCAIGNDELLAIMSGAASQVKKAADYLGIDLSGAVEALAPAVYAPPAPSVDPSQQKLTNEMRNMALSAELAQSFARQKNDAQLLEVVRQNARIMFNLEDTLLFLVNSSGQALVSMSVGEQRQKLVDFSISLTDGGGISQATLLRRVAFLGPERQQFGIAEDQLRRALGAECLVCVPIATNSKSLGVLVGGIAAWRAADLKQNERFLQSFGGQAAAALDAASAERGEMDRRIASVRQEHQEESRRVVHEINNPLTIIKNYLGVLDDKIARQEPISGELSILNEEIDRVGNIMNEFAGATPRPQTALTDVNRVVQDLVKLFRESRFLPPSVQINAKPASKPTEMDGSADLLKQILVNLIKNAIEALPKGGQIEIVNNGPTDRQGRVFHELLVKDTGGGLPADVLANLFSPVRSTKAGENRGIGLSIVHGLVKKLNGLISCQSSLTGTTFQLLLPAGRSTSVGLSQLQARVRDEA